MAWSGRPISLVAAAACVAWLPACNTLLGNDSWTLADAGGDGTTLTGDSSSAHDTSGGFLDAPDTSNGMADANKADSSLFPPDSAGTDTGSPLNPGLVLPPASGSSCDPSQGDADCPTGETCRISSVNFGRCDTYATSGGVGDWPCTLDSDCNDTLQCYMGYCKVLCPLGETCSGGCECFDVGNETTGLCCPGIP